MRYLDFCDYESVEGFAEPRIYPGFEFKEKEKSTKKGAKGRPLKSYASQRLLGQGGALPFALSFDPQSLPGDGRFELRARVSQSGRLILRLPPQALNPTQSRDFGPLQLVRAP